MTPFARCSTRCPDPAGFVRRGYMTKYIHPWSWSDAANVRKQWWWMEPPSAARWRRLCRHCKKTSLQENVSLAAVTFLSAQSILRSLPQLSRFDSSIRVTVGLCWKTMLCNYIQLHLG